MVKINYKMKLCRIIFLFMLMSSTKGQIIINEFLASNFISDQDEYGDYDDWIELINSSEDSLILSA